ncbi:MAG: sulfatase [Bacteroidota bacterium]
MSTTLNPEDNRILQLYATRSMNKLIWLYCLLLIISCDTRPTSAPPNVLWIMVDDLNSWVGYLKGHPQTLTPNIDRLAARGMAFHNAHTNSPLCGPSRASMLTGLLPSSTGIYFHIQDTELVPHTEQEQITLLPYYFQQQGYRTLAVGKIFHNGDRAGVFDEYGGLSNFGPRPEERFNYDPEWFDKPRGTSTDWGVFPSHDTLTFDHRIADWAIGRLEENHESPFLLAAGFMRPHVPWYVPQKWFDAFPLDQVALPPYDSKDWEDLPPVAKEMTYWPMMPEMDWMLEEDRWREAVQAYLASVHFVDHQIGRLLDALERSLYADNTIIVLASDHGYHVGEKGLFQKGTLWRRSKQIPMIWAGPGIEAGSTMEPASLLDIYPTLADWCGEEVPDHLQGQSVAPILTGEKSTINNAAITTFGPGNHSVYSPEWHLIQYDNGAQELYHLAEDPNEWRNVAGSENELIIRELVAKLPAQEAPNLPQSAFGAAPYFNR